MSQSPPADHRTSAAEAERIDLISLALKVWDQKWLGIALIVTYLAIAVVYLRGATYIYTADLLVTPADQGSARSTGNLASLGSLVGLNVGGQQGTAFSMYTEAVRSQPVADRLSSDRRIMRTIFAGSWDPVRKSWRKPTSAFEPARNALKDLMGVPTKPWQPPNSQDLQQFISESVAVSEDTKKGYVSLSYSNADGQFAAYLLEQLNRHSDDFLREKSLSRSLSYVTYLERRLAEVQVAEYRQSLAEALGAYEKTAMMARSDASFAAETFGRVSISPWPTSPKPKAVIGLSFALAIVTWILLTLLAQPLFRRIREEQRTKKSGT